jgi:hypothetical protein
MGASSQRDCLAVIEFREALILTEFSQGCMRHFSGALSRLDLTDFTRRVTAEAKQSDLETTEDAAISRLRPIQDSPDVWELHRSSAGTV